MFGSENAHLHDKLLVKASAHHRKLLHVCRSAHLRADRRKTPKPRICVDKQLKPVNNPCICTDCLEISCPHICRRSARLPMILGTMSLPSDTVLQGGQQNFQKNSRIFQGHLIKLKDILIARNFLVNISIHAIIAVLDMYKVTFRKVQGRSGHKRVNGLRDVVPQKKKKCICGCFSMPTRKIFQICETIFIRNI